MTIASTTSKVSYNGSGSTGPFPITYKFTKNADIAATKRSSAGVETVLALTTDYTLTGAGDAAGGSLTLTVALAVGESLVIARAPSIVQEVDYVENSAFPAETHESALDLLTTICQSLQEQIDRSVKVEISSTTNPDDLLAELAVDVASAATSAANAEAARDLAQDYANDISTNVHAATATAGQTTIVVTGWTLPASLDNVLLFINGLAQAKATLTRTNDTTLTLDEALVGDEIIDLRAAGFNPSATADAVAAASAAHADMISASSSAGTAATQAGLASGYAVTAQTHAGTATTQAGLASGYAASAAASAASAAAIVNPSIHSRAIGGLAYKEILGIICPPSLERKMWDALGLTNKIPAGLTFTRASAASYAGPTGALSTAASGELRHEWDAITGEYKGILVEGQRTNFLLNSGTPATQSVSLAAGTYTVSVVGSGSVALSGGPTGTATEAAPVTFTLGGTTTVTFTVSGSLTRFQCENGPFKSSYIATTGASATRAADRLSLATSAFPFNSAEGTLYVEARRLFTAHSDYPVILGVYDGTAANSLMFFAVPNSGAIYASCSASSAVQASILAGDGNSAGVNFRAAYAFKQNDFAACINGGTLGTDTSGSIPTVSSLTFGFGPGADFYGHIRHAMYFPRRLSNSDLQLLTK